MQGTKQINLRPTLVSDAYIELAATSDDATVTYLDVERAIQSMIDSHGELYEGWVIDNDMSRVGVGVTASGANDRPACIIHASITRVWAGAPIMPLVSRR